MYIYILICMYIYIYIEMLKNADFTKKFCL